jgi:vibriolysin
VAAVPLLSTVAITPAAADDGKCKTFMRNRSVVFAWVAALAVSVAASDRPTLRSDVAAALAALPEVEVLAAQRDGFPTFLRGDLGRISSTLLAESTPGDPALSADLAPVFAAFCLTPADVTLVRHSIDRTGNHHLRYAQSFNGLDVIGGDLLVHVDAEGTSFAVNGTARGDIPTTLGSQLIGEAAALARIAADARFVGMSHGDTRRVYIITADGEIHHAYETIVTGVRGDDPVRDKVFVSVDTGEIVAVHPQIFFARNRRVHSANHGATLPGTLLRSEGQAPVADIDVNAVYAATGAFYEVYQTFLNRDSYDDAGGALVSSVHYGVSYCNLFWNGTQMVYGDGNLYQGCLPPVWLVDMTAHELTHAVTARESNLTYSGESGGLNESISDAFGAFVEAWVDGGKGGTLAISADTWKMGEDVLPPALRYMNDPAADGVSLDFWTAGAGSVDVHYSSGIGNLAFYLLSQGGRHPRGKSTVQVTGIGMEKAIRVLYKMNTDLMTSTTNYWTARNAALVAATNLGLTPAERDSVQNAWAAVGVGAPATSAGSPIVLTDSRPFSGLAASKDSQTFFQLTVPAGATSLSFQLSAGSGDADLYVRIGSAPTLTTFDCRPYLNDNDEICNFSAPQAGTYYVMIHAHAAYSGVTLVGDFRR